VAEICLLKERKNLKLQSYPFLLDAFLLLVEGLRQGSCFKSVEIEKKLHHQSKPSHRFWRVD
jgi:hypothetical protein